MTIDAGSAMTGHMQKAGAIMPAALALFLGAILGTASAGPARGDEPPPARRDFRGVWAGNGSVCRTPDEFLLVYDRRTVRLPYRSSLQPDRECRIVSVKGRHPEWELLLSCQYPDPRYRLPRRFAVRQKLKMSADRFEMIVETQAVLGQPASVEDTFYCRETNVGPPQLICFDPVSNTTMPCPP